MENSSKLILTPLIAGGVAGLTVDISLYPIDTIKTRLQSRTGFLASGGFSGIYRGIGAVMVGSVPSAALFFLSYEGVKALAEERGLDKRYQPLVNVLAASVGEVIACVVRVPVEIAKQRRQTLSCGSRSGLGILMEAYRVEGFCSGLYRGFLSTVLRDLPFSFIQFPLWEYFKTIVAENSSHGAVTSLEAAFCGSISGAIAGAVTTPLDVAKTRIMLAPASPRPYGVRHMLFTVYAEKGIRGLFAGLLPRITSFALGGAIFLGAYDYATSQCDSWFKR